MEIARAPDHGCRLWIALPWPIRHRRRHDDIPDVFWPEPVSFGTLTMPLSWIANMGTSDPVPAGRIPSCCPNLAAIGCPPGLRPTRFSADLAATTYVIIASAQVLALFALWTPSGLILLASPRWAVLDAKCALWRQLAAARQSHSGCWGSACRRVRLAGGRCSTTEGLRYPGTCPQVDCSACAASRSIWPSPAHFGRCRVRTPDQLLIATGLTAYCLVGPLFKEARFASGFSACALLTTAKSGPIGCRLHARCCNLSR